MNISPLGGSMSRADLPLPAAASRDAEKLKQGGDQTEVRAAFDKFVGETLFGQMLKSMRETVGKPAYFHGGRAEEVFQQQLDQHLAEELAKNSAQSFADPMFDLFMARRS